MRAKESPPIFVEEIFKISFCPKCHLMESLGWIWGNRKRRHHLAIWVFPNSSVWMEYTVCFHLASLTSDGHFLWILGLSRVTNGGRRPQMLMMKGVEKWEWEWKVLAGEERWGEQAGVLSRTVQRIQWSWKESQRYKKLEGRTWVMERRSLTWVNLEQVFVSDH